MAPADLEGVVEGGVEVVGQGPGVGVKRYRGRKTRAHRGEEGGREGIAKEDIILQPSSYYNNDKNNNNKIIKKFLIIIIIINNQNNN